MADTKITALTAITTVDPAVDVLPIVDVSDTTMAASGTTKKITSNQILGAGGTATLASATITGDLTVDTSTLKVTASTDTVTVGATTTDAKFRVVDASYNGLRIGFLPGTANYNLYDATVHEFRTANVTPQQLYTLQASSSVWYDGAGGTRMTLNSTGLGVGASPSFKLHVQQTLAGTASAVNPLAYIVNNGSGNTAKLTLSDAVTTDGNITLTGSATAANRLLGFGINGVQQMVLDGNGNVGIGVTPSAWGSGIKGLELGSLGSGITSGGTFGGSLYATMNAYNDGSWKFARNADAGLYGLNSDKSFAWYQSSNAPSVGGAITWTQAMTLTAGGELLVGVTAAPSGTIGGSGFISATNSRKQLHIATTSTITQALVAFINPNGVVGTIETNGSSTAYNVSSDYRLKESVQPMAGALNRVAALKPSTYKWKVDGSSGEGFIAHELAQVVPLAVTGEKDAVNEDGSIKAQGVDLSKVVPVLVAAIQELAAEVNALKNA